MGTLIWTFKCIPVSLLAQVLLQLPFLSRHNNSKNIRRSWYIRKTLLGHIIFSSASLSLRGITETKYSWPIIVFHIIETDCSIIFHLFTAVHKLYAVLQLSNWSVDKRQIWRPCLNVIWGNQSEVENMTFSVFYSIALLIWRGTFCWKPHLNWTSGSKVMSIEGFSKQ